jgi:dynein light intermediate chain 2, cytosolic
MKNSTNDLDKEDAPHKVSKHSKDIWSLVKETSASRTQDRGRVLIDKVDLQMESYIFVAGASNSCKSTIISRFLEKEDKPTPTVALEYTFGRRSKGQNGAKDIAHIYELGLIQLTRGWN